MSDKPKKTTNPRILIVTPEITYLPKGMGNLAQRLSAKAGGLADVSASLVKALYDLGADVHVALPNYRRMFHLDVQERFRKSYDQVTGVLPEQQIHLAEDRVFYHQSQVYNASENHLIALAFQREVINHILPAVQPDLVHCNDWMTGLIPGVARHFGIPSLFTIHNIHTERLSLETIEDRGIDAAEYWKHWFFTNPPGSYEDTRSSNPCDFFTSGIFAAHHVNAVSTSFLYEMVEGRHTFVPDAVRSELANKLHAGCASGILNAPDPSFDPATDTYLEHHFTAATHVEGKRKNKVLLQQKLGLDVNPDAPVFFWPSRLDPVQKGCQLLTDILYQLTEDYSDENLQVAVVASGSFKEHFERIVKFHDIGHRVGIANFDEGLSHLGYAGSDFMTIPSLFEPCGLPQMVSPKYGTLSIAHNTGGLHDTVDPLDIANNSGNGFRFDVFDASGFRWAIDRAMDFYHLDPDTRATQVARIMEESSAHFNHTTTAAAYIKTYEEMLQRPLTN
ncbi:MAG: glycogen/starch synthase [Verrucomicrobiales bacterium]|nr:glycogen/starch synthase [Verrucomicrobiales bacterium]